MSIEQTIPIQAIAKKRIWGRTAEQSSALSLFWTGSGVELVLKSSWLWMELEADYDVYEPWVSILVNGECTSRFMVQKGKQWVCVYRNLSAESKKHVQLVKDVQAMSADSEHILIVHAIKHDGELLDMPAYERKIEFIGDSITSGEGGIGAREEQDWVSMWFSAINNYTRYTALELNAEYRVVSQSGWGVYSSWDEHREYNIPSYYTQVCGLLNGAEQVSLGAHEAYDFKSWQPNYIVVNLGTNDASAFRRLVERAPFNKAAHHTYITEFQAAIVSFLSLIRKHNPTSHIIWAYGMLGYELAEQIEESVKWYSAKQSDFRVSFVRLPSMTDETVGSRSHPGQALHLAAAQLISQYIKNIN